MVTDPGKWPDGTWALVLRAVIGYGFMAHGFAKLAKGVGTFGGILHAIGVPAPDLMAWLTVMVELLGGLAVFVGAFVATASIPLVIVLLVAMFTVHLPYGFSSIKLLAVTSRGAQFGPPGYEMDLIYIACLIALAIGGAGPLSVDRLLTRGRGRNHRRIASPQSTR
jgi:putative oxidoreductase